MSVLTKILLMPLHFPLVRGMVSYAVIWPTCSIVQEYLEHGTTLENANWSRAARFGIFGTFFMAPVFYGWMKYSSRFFTRKDLFTAISRAAIEQISYSPLAMAYFFFGMSLLEGKSYKVCINEVHEKFWPTYKIGVIFWPAAQTLNFYFISEKNRIVFVSIASFVWTVYLAHMKGKQQKDDDILILDSQSLVALKSAENKQNASPIVLGIKSDLTDQKPIGAIDDVNEKNQVSIVERGSDLIENNTELVSNVHISHVAESQKDNSWSQPAVKEKHEDTSIKDN